MFSSAGLGLSIPRLEIRFLLFGLRDFHFYILAVIPTLTYSLPS
jgi:hypothetical protein